MTDNATQREINFAIKVPGAQEGAQSMAAFASSLKQAGQATSEMQATAKAAGSSLKLVVDNTKQASDSLAQISANTKKAEDAFKGVAIASSRSAAAMNIVGGELAKINPELATMVQAVGRSSGAISGFASIVSGPWALAIGAAVAGVGLWIDKTRKETEEQEKLADAVKKTNERIEEGVKLARSISYKGAFTAELGQLSTLRGNLADLKSGVMTDQRQRDIEDTQRAIADLERQQEQASRAETMSKYASDQDAYLRLRASLGDKTAIAELAGTKAAPDEFRGLPTRGNQPLTQIELSRSDLMAVQRQADSTAADAGVVKFAEGQRDALGRAQDKKDALDKEFALQRAHTARMVQDAKSGARSISAEYEKTEKDAEKRREAMQAGAVNAFTAVGTVGAQALIKLAEGQKMSFGAVLKGIGEILIADGVRDELRAGAEAIMLNPAAPALALVGVAEIAAGAVLVGGGRLSGSSRSGSGGGGGGGPNRSGAPIGNAPTYWNGTEFVRGAPSSPYVGPSGGSTGIVNINNNVTLQSYVTPNGDDAVRVQRAYDEAYRLGKLPRPKAA